MARPIFIVYVILMVQCFFIFQLNGSKVKIPIRTILATKLAPHLHGTILQQAAHL